jgi:hypothetical protein
MTGGWRGEADYLTNDENRENCRQAARISVESSGDQHVHRRLSGSIIRTAIHGIEVGAFP